MNKQIIYFIPGLAANSKIFEFLKLPEELFDIRYIEWLQPLSKDESITNYAKRMSEKITEDNCIIAGVSFGGVMAQEISKIINPKKTIIISSIKNKDELPINLKLAQKTKIYKLLPTKVIENFEDYEQYFIGNYLKKRASLYKKYLSVRNPLYIEWAVKTILNWKQENYLDNLIHIQGTKDEIFPINNISNFIPIKDGTHSMVIFKAKKLSSILEKECFL